MPRVHGHSGKPLSNAPLGIRVCQWCGGEFAPRDPSALFCSDPHRHAFNNLRKERGAIIYDLLMVMRFERKLSAQLKLWSKVCTILSNFRREDREQRAGRDSWRRPSRLLEQRPDLLAKVILPGRKGQEK